MHSGTFDYLKPTDEQMVTMNDMREAARMYADAIEEFVPNGPDKTYILRKLREVAMWVNMSITRGPDGGPRSD